MSAVIRCSLCNRRCRNVAGWNVETRGGRIVAHLCPTCQTPEQSAEAEINAATINYLGRDSDGHWYGIPKVQL